MWDVFSRVQEVIIKFAGVPEPEFPGHVLLEQYQAQVCKHVQIQVCQSLSLLLVFGSIE